MSGSQVTKSWKPGVSFTAGESSVIHGGYHYICKVSHTSGDNDDEPGVGAEWETYWELPPNAGGIAEAPVDGESYIRKDSGWSSITSIFSSILQLFTNQVLTVNSVGSGASITASGMEVTKAWEPGLNYTAGETSVIHGGNTYTCIVSHKSSSTDEPGVGSNYATYWSVGAGLSDAPADSNNYVRKDNAWVALSGSSGDMLSTNNLSDLNDIPTALNNLGIYSSAEIDTMLSMESLVPQFSDQDLTVNSLTAGQVTTTPAGIPVDTFQSSNSGDANKTVAVISSNVTDGTAGAVKADLVISGKDGTVGSGVTADLIKYNSATDKIEFKKGVDFQGTSITGISAALNNSVKGMNVVTKAANYTVLTTDAFAFGGMIYVDTNGVVITAPNISVGTDSDYVNFCVAAKGNITFYLDVGANDNQILNGITLSDGKQAISNGVSGDMICLTPYNSSSWYTTGNSVDGTAFTGEQ